MSGQQVRVCARARVVGPGVVEPDEFAGCVSVGVKLDGYGRFSITFERY